MTKRQMDQIASVKARLLNVAKANYLTFESVLRRYFQERLLYRLSVSEYGDYFILKGGVLFLTIRAPFGRPTKDIDFLSETENGPERLRQIFSEVVAISGEDTVRFDPNSIYVETIQETAEQTGIRIKLTAYLGRTRDTIQIDIGFGDVVYPRALKMSFPTLLDDRIPLIKVYSNESIIAEKLETMAKLSFANSRMKDFYDVWLLAKEFDFEGGKLCTAARRTFGARGRETKEAEEVMGRNFADDPANNKMWKAFLSRSRIENTPSEFAIVMETIRRFLMPILRNNRTNTPFRSSWDHFSQTWVTRIPKDEKNRKVSQ